MVPTVQDVADAALLLTPAERRLLVEQLLDSLAPVPELHPAWHAEIARRLAATHHAGATQDRTADEAIALLGQHIARRRPAA